MTDTLSKIFKHDASGGVALMAAAALALLIANTPMHDVYQSWLSLPVTFAFGDFSLSKPLLLWINDGLMAVFFFLIGLEVKREVFTGHLSSKEQIALPAIAAFAGIAVPALLYAAFNYQDAVNARGWAVPAATDIAFALGVYALFGRSLPITLKLFLLSVAIFDDIGAILIIALFYSSELSTTSLAFAAAGMVTLFAFNRFKVNQAAPYLLVGLIVWVAVLKSGVHATLAGFAIAWFIPLEAGKSEERSMLFRMEHDLHPWVTFMILPLFAFANAGVRIVDTPLVEMFNPIVIGIVAGLFIGKQLGIFTACWLAIKSGFASLPQGVSWAQLYAVSTLCGIGFTMSLFVGSLAFEGMDSDYLNSVKVGVVAGSILSALMGAALLSRLRSQSAATAGKRSKMITDAIN